MPITSETLFQEGLSVNIRPIATEEDLRQVSEWIYSEWGSIRPDNSVEKVTEFFRPRLLSDSIPLTLVGTESGEIVGTASLVKNEAQHRPDLTPFLSALYVRSDRRATVAGEKLFAAVLNRAKDLGFVCCYLISDKLEAYYRKRGWSVIESFERHGKKIVLMKIDV